MPFIRGYVCVTINYVTCWVNIYNARERAKDKYYEVMMLQDNNSRVVAGNKIANGGNDIFFFVVEKNKLVYGLGQVDVKKSTGLKGYKLNHRSFSYDIGKILKKIIMNRCDLYCKVQYTTLEGSEKMLHKYFHIKPQNIYEKKTLLDIGSGPGNFTCTLLPLFKGLIEKAIGIDISNEMVDFANANYGNSILSFEVLDIRHNVPSKYLNCFDYVFSFWTLHWIKDQRKLFTNIFEMMKSRGTMFVTYIAYTELHNIYKEVWNTEKYSLYITDTDKGQSPFQNCENRKEELERILNAVGFQVEMCKIENILLAVEKNTIKDLLLSINPVYEQIPKELQKEFLEDHLKRIDASDSEYKINYELFVVCAKKN
ncbi:hypothetical protein FQA39_LY01666 [Lamprigera yunnana]|nr:hypothetical protein FQA39_LY01666 [Lamprigera yunnana]